MEEDQRNLIKIASRLWLSSPVLVLLPTFVFCVWSSVCCSVCSATFLITLTTFLYSKYVSLLWKCWRDGKKWVSYAVCQLCAVYIHNYLYGGVTWPISGWDLAASGRWLHVCYVNKQLFRAPGRVGGDIWEGARHNGKSGTHGSGRLDKNIAW